MTKPIIAGRTQPIPIDDKGKYVVPNSITVLENAVSAMNLGLALRPSINAAIIVKYVVNWYTVREWLKYLLNSVNKINVIANGYKNIKTGSEYL